MTTQSLCGKVVPEDSALQTQKSVCVRGRHQLDQREGRHECGQPVDALVSVQEEVRIRT